MSNRRHVVSAVLVAIGAIVYGASPIDVIPELFGPLGFADDILVLFGAGVAVWKLLKGRRPGATGVTPPPAA